MSWVYQNGDTKPAGACPCCGSRGRDASILADYYSSGVDYYCQDCDSTWSEEKGEWRSITDSGYIEEA